MADLKYRFVIFDFEGTLADNLKLYPGMEGLVMEYANAGVRLTRTIHPKKP